MFSITKAYQNPAGKIVKIDYTISIPEGLELTSSYEFQPPYGEIPINSVDKQTVRSWLFTGITPNISSFVAMVEEGLTNQYQKQQTEATWTEYNLPDNL